MTASPDRLARLRWLWWLPPIVLVALAYLDTLDFGLVGDARFLVAENAYLDGWRHLLGNLTHDYFWSSSGNSIPYWRPFTKASWLVEAQLLGRGAAGFHLAQLAWHLVGVGGVMALARRLGASATWAALAGLLYGLHPALVEPVSLVMARSDVVSAAAVVWSLAAWHAWALAGDDGRRRWAALHVVALVVALGSKESAVIVAPLVTLWALLAGHGRPGQRHRLSRVAPAWGLAAVYLLARQAALAGYAAPALVLDPARVFVGAGVYLRGALPLQITSPVHNTSFAEAAAWSTLAAAGAAWALALVATAAAWRLRRLEVVVLLAWVAASLAPVLLVEQMNVPGVAEKIPLADRWMAQAVAATAVLVTLLASSLRRAALAWAARLTVLAWAVVMLVVAASAHAPYASEDALLGLEDARYEATPVEWRTGEDDCRALDRAAVRLLAAGDDQRALTATDAVTARCGVTNDRLFNRLGALAGLERWPEARAVARSLLDRPRADTRFVPPAELYLGMALARTGDPRAAREALTRAEALGLPDCRLHLELAHVAELLQQPAEEASRLERAHACLVARGAAADPMMLATAAYWRLRAHQPAEARRLVERLRAQGAAGPDVDPRLAQRLRQLDALLDASAE